MFKHDKLLKDFPKDTGEMEKQVKKGLKNDKKASDARWKKFFNN